MLFDFSWGKNVILNHHQMLFLQIFISFNVTFTNIHKIILFLPVEKKKQRNPIVLNP